MGPLCELQEEREGSSHRHLLLDAWISPSRRGALLAALLRLHGLLWAGSEQAGPITYGAVGNETFVLAVTGGRQVALETSGGHISCLYLLDLARLKLSHSHH